MDAHLRSAFSERLHLIRQEKEAVAGLPQLAEVPAWIVVHDDSQVDAPLEVLLDRLDRGGPPLQGQIEDVSAATGPEADAIAPPQLRRADVNALQSPPVCLRAPVFHPPSPSSGRRPRTVPCSRSSCSRASASVRPSSARARSSTAAACRFSSSVSVRMRRV